MVSGTTITSTWANNTMSDMASETTDSLNRSGKGAMLAPLRLTNGTNAAPSLTFDSDTDTGFYRVGANDLGITIGGTLTGEVTANGILSANGAVGTPAFSFISDPDTGLYRIGANNPAIAAAGAKAQEWSSTGTTIPGTLAVTGASTLSSTLAVTGNVAINTDKFTVTAGSGNTLVAGTLDVTSNVAVNTNKFNVTASSGNTLVAGTLGVTGATTLTGAAAANGGLSIGPSGTAIASSFRSTYTIDFANTSAGQCTASSQTLTGAAAGAECIGGTTVAICAACHVQCKVTAADTVSVMFCNNTGGASDPASGSYSARVFNP